MNGAERVARLKHRKVLACGDELDVPKFIRRYETKSSRGWRLDLGPSGVFKEGAEPHVFSDRIYNNGPFRSPTESLEEAKAYLATIYLCPAARGTTKSRTRHPFMPPGLQLKLRRPAYRSKQPGMWVILVRGGVLDVTADEREYVIIGEDGKISQACLVKAMKEAMTLRMNRLIERGKHRAEVNGIQISSKQLIR